MSNNVLTIREAVTRCKEEGLTVSEYALRGWVKSGEIAARKVGQKSLIYYPNLVRYLQCADDTAHAPTVTDSGGIRRLEV